ncbi:MAG: methyltransferase domain-containing protein [Deltaproteobacteria bacterium]|nr:methyltransferase domain-containing protein [Deltaproteobacteria bacterium]
MLDPAVLRAREYFPRGLSQPDAGFRFSLDALLLAAFARQGASRVLDLGTGCGVVGLAWALIHPDSFVVGLDANPAMLVHARENARRLGLAGRFAAVRADVARPGGFRPESMDLVLCNPPYRDPGTGRVCPHVGKNAARFESGAVLADFIRATAFVLRNRKPCAFIHLAERVDDLLGLLSEHRLRPKELLFVHPKPDVLARLVLVLAVKNGGPGLTVAAPLVLHGEAGLTAQALAFCPWLACNSR